VQEITFKTRHDDFSAQSGSAYENTVTEGFVQHPPEGCKVIYVNHTNFETTLSAPEQVANRAREWLWRVIVEWNGTRLTKPIDPEYERTQAERKAARALLPKVTKMEKGHAEWMEPDAEGHYHIREKEDKPRWKCPCGLVWTMKHDAQECTSRGHIPHYDIHYGGTNINGQYVGSTTYTIRAIRKEEVNHDKTPK